MKPFTALTRDEVTFKLTIEDEDIPVRGSAMASGDDKADHACENAIITRLERGDLWAWCCVVVTATWGHWSGADSLGACSYDGETDFRVSSGHYESMCHEALACLNEAVKADYEALAARAETAP
jgi:hypothetical protein